MEVALQMSRKLGARMWRTNMLIVGWGRGGSGTMAEGDFRFYDMFLPLAADRGGGIRRIPLSLSTNVATDLNGSHE